MKILHLLAQAASLLGQQQQNAEYAAQTETGAIRAGLDMHGSGRNNVAQSINLNGWQPTTTTTRKGAEAYRDVGPIPGAFPASVDPGATAVEEDGWGLDESTVFGPAADAGDVFKHLREVKHRLDKVLAVTETEHGLSGMMPIGTLAEMKRQNLRLAKQTALFAFGMDMVDATDNEDDYTVYSPTGYRISGHIGIVAPRTEAELQRQIEYSSDPVHWANVLRETIRIWNDVLLKDPVVKKYSNLGRGAGAAGANLHVTPVQGAKRAVVSGRPSICDTEVRQCPGNEVRILVDSTTYLCRNGNGGTEEFIVLRDSTNSLCADCAEVDDNAVCRPSPCLTACM